MGDSYSSGEGTGVYYAGTDTDSNQCHRSPEAYGPMLFESTRGLKPLSFVACSGAVTRDFYNASAKNPSEGPQLDALQTRTKAVTLTIGGNDVVFEQVAKACVESIRTPGRFGCADDDDLNAAIDAGLAALAGKGTTSAAAPSIVPIKQILEDISDKSPRAKIYLAGYPELFGDSQTHFSVDQTAPSGSSCVVIPAAAGRVDLDDTKFINERTRELNEVMSTAVKQARREGIRATYVPPSTFDGHGLCDDEGSWIQPVLLETSGAIAPESLHPTSEGQNGYQRAFERAGF